MPSAAEITRHHDPDPDEDPWVHGPPSPATVAVVAYDPSWPDRYAALAAEVRAALGDVVLDIDHVGSTAVPGLAAKDVIDTISRWPTRQTRRPTSPLWKPSAGGTWSASRRGTSTAP